MSRKRTKPTPEEREAKAAEAAAKNPDPLGHRALAGLKKLRDELVTAEPAPTAKKGNVAPAAPVAKKTVAKSNVGEAEVWRPDLDKEMFSIAMSGVKPLGEPEKARRVKSGGSSGKDAGAAMRRAQAEGDEGLVVKFSENGSFEAARKGRSFALAALGRFSAAQDTLDLHGLDPGEARGRVEEFVRVRRAKGKKVVAVVHGAGKHAPDGASLLRDVVIRALSEPPGSREVDAFRSADGANGDGAVMVALRGG